MRHPTKVITFGAGIVPVCNITMGYNVAHMSHTVTPTWRICAWGAPSSKCIRHAHLAHLRHVVCLEQASWDAGVQGVTRSSFGTHPPDRGVTLVYPHVQVGGRGFCKGVASHCTPW